MFFYHQAIVLSSFERNSVLLLSCNVFLAILTVPIAILQSMLVSICVVFIRLPIALGEVRQFWHETVVATDCKLNHIDNVVATSEISHMPPL